VAVRVALVEGVCSRLPNLDGDKIIGAVSFATFTETDQLHSAVNMYEQVKSELKLVKLELRQLRAARYSIDQTVGDLAGIEREVAIAFLGRPGPCRGDSNDGLRAITHPLATGGNL
jgi:hypothetical protein